MVFEGLTGLPPPMHISCPEHLTRSVRRASGFVLTAQGLPTRKRARKAAYRRPLFLRGRLPPAAGTASHGRLVLRLDGISSIGSARDGGAENTKVSATPQ